MFSTSLCAGKPTDTPDGFAMRFDTDNSILWVYNPINGVAAWQGTYLVNNPNNG